MKRWTDTNLMGQIAARKKRLGMSYAVLAARSGVSEATLKRMLNADDQQQHSPRIDCLTAVLDSLGMSLVTKPTLKVEELRYREADAKARRLVQLLQGTSALEEQGLDKAEIERLVSKARQELLDGTNRRLWAS